MSSPKSSREEKIRWLMAHEEIWRKWPHNSEWIERRVISGFKASHLLSTKTNLRGVMDLGKLIAEARSRWKR